MIKNTQLNILPLAILTGHSNLNLPQNQSLLQAKDKMWQEVVLSKGGYVSQVIMSGMG